MAGYQLGVIGGGGMGEAILRGIVGASVLNHNVLLVSEPRRERRRLLMRDLQVTCVDDDAAAAACPHVLLAVKSHVLAEVLDGIAPSVAADAVVVCVAAGISTSFLDERLGGRGRIVRAMPNPPLVVGRGMTAVARGPRATDGDLHWTGNLFAACGQVVRVTEEMMDAVAAVSVSGPAYFFYLIEAMIAAGTAEGLAPEVAARLAAEACAGAAQLLAQTGERPEVLRVRVAGLGAATRRALEALDGAGVKARLVEAIRAAAEASRQLRQ